jgi:hypothetical protein
MIENFEYKVIFYDDVVKLQDYDKLLKNFKQWTQFKRDIKLITILEGKRIQYDIEDIQSNIPIYGTIGYEDDMMLKNAAFVVKGMSFIINGDNIDELKVKIQFLNTNCGKIVKETIKNGIDPIIKQRITPNKFIHFYIDE